MIKYLKFAPYLAVVILFFLLQSALKDKKYLDSEFTELNQKYITCDANLKSAKDFVNKLQKAKTKVDTVYKIIKGDTKIIYKTVFKTPDSVSVIDTTNNIKTLFDGFKNDELELNYLATYSGEIYDINFDWNIKEKIVIKDHIIYETVYKDKIVYKNKSYYYASYYYGDILHDFNFGYVSKSKIGFGCGATIFNKNVYPKFGITVLF